MATIRQQLIDAIRDALDAAGKPEGLYVAKRTAIPAETVDLPRVTVSRDGEKSQPAVPGKRSPVTERFLTIRLDWWVQGKDSEDLLEPFLAWGTAAMMTAPGWGGLAIETTEESTEWDTEDEDEESLGQATQRFTVRYATKTTDQESRQ